MSLSAKEAAEQVGLSKQAILKAIHEGRLSATRDNRGAWRIEPVELLRVYAPAPTGAKIDNQPTANPDAARLAALEAENATLRQLVANQEQQLADQEQQLADLRRWLDAAMAALPPRPQLEDKQQPVSLWRKWFPKRSQT